MLSRVITLASFLCTEIVLKLCCNVLHLLRIYSASDGFTCGAHLDIIETLYCIVIPSWGELTNWYLLLAQSECTGKPGAVVALIVSLSRGTGSTRVLLVNA
ncbi:hypothetical protein F5146DRAFT_728560 [Armillaria mellea]|nr:hypothetical protein F5146DRAFT_728560 [Armillaria mellea]